MSSPPAVLTRIAAGACGVVLLAGLLVSLQPTRAAAAELSELGKEAFADIAACVATGDHLLASIVVDASTSLTKTDPKNMRVGAVLTALDSLEQLHEVSQGRLVVEANLATFGIGYSELVGWGAVSGDHANALKQATKNTLPSRNTQAGTNYEEALSGARDSLNGRAAQLGGASCKLVFWFTDGGLSVPGHEEDVHERICDPQGLADTLRGDNIFVIGLALFNSGGADEVKPLDRQRFKSIVEGEGDGVSPCGTVPIPQTDAQGAYLLADDAKAIRLLFSQATAMIQGATPGSSAVCPGANCEGGVLPIPVDAGIGGIRLVLDHVASAEAPALRAPDSEPIPLVTGSRAVKGATLQVSDRDGLMTVDADFGPESSAVGTWLLDLGTAGTTLVDLYYKWGVTLQITAPESLLIGEPGVIEVMPVDRNSNPIDRAIYRDLTLDPVVGGARLISTEPTNTGWKLSVEIDPSDVKSAVRVDVTVHAQTRMNSIRLGPITAHAELATRFSPSFPTVSTHALSLGTIEGQGSSSGFVEFVGSTEGETRACITEIELHGPKAAGQMSVDPVGDSCVVIPANGNAELEVRTTPEHAADGRAEGHVTLTLHGVNDDDELSLTVPVSVTMIRPVNQGVLWYLVALLVAAAVGSAWIAAEIMRRSSERFRLTPDARFAAVPVLVTAQGVQRLDGKVPLLDAAQDFEAVDHSERGRVAGFSLAGLTFGRSFNPFNPLSEGRPWVESFSEVLTVPGGDQLMLNSDGSRAPVRFPGTVDFVFAAIPSSLSDGAIEGRLVVIIDSAMGVSSVLQPRLDQIAEAPWDRILEAIGRAVDTRNAASTEPSSTGSSNHSTATAGAERMPTTAAFMAEATDNQLQGSPPPPSWADDTSSTPTRIPEATPPRRKSRRSPKEQQQRDELKSTKSSLPPGEPDGPPPSSMNFWD